MQNKLYVGKPNQPTMDKTKWQVAVDCPDKRETILFVHGDSSKQAQERAQLIVDAFNNAGLGPFLP